MSGGARRGARRATAGRARLLGLVVVVVAFGGACAGERPLAARTWASGGEKLDARVALYVAPSQLAVEFLNYAEGDDRAAYTVRVGEALRDLASAHLAEVVAIVEPSEAPRAPLDAAREAFLVELETQAFDATTDGASVTWKVGVRVSDALGLRGLRAYEETGTLAGALAGAADAGAAGRLARHERLELAANDAMRRIVGRLWGDLSDLAARAR